ncbi:intersectin-1-like [Tubulanus polymorphus]|uniref:intersectin-1-like n=1 Tax=Tubulanus polymorphus TaxID=672921 RepID=UPI003DA35C37
MSWNKFDEQPIYAGDAKPTRKAPPPPSKPGQPRTYGAIDNPLFKAPKPIPASKPGSSDKRKIEITVVDARPMSEVGFRSDSAPLKTAPINPPPKVIAKPTKPESIFYPESVQTDAKKPTIIRPKKPPVPAAKKSSVTAPPPSASLIDFSPEIGNNEKKHFPVKPLAPTVSSDRVPSLSSRRSSAASTISGHSFDEAFQNDFVDKKSKPKPPRPGKPPPKRPPKPKFKPKIPPSSSTSALDELMCLDSNGFHTSNVDRNINNPSPLSLQFDTSSCQVKWDIFKDKKLSSDQVDLRSSPATVSSNPWNQPASMPASNYSLEGLPHGKALFDYDSPHETDLSFKQGDYILLLRWIDDDWICGELDGREGMFPKNFIEVIEPLPEDRTEEVQKPSHTANNLDISRPRCRALFDFEAQTADDLSFSSGDIIRLLSRIQTEWAQGELNGVQGLFPLAFVEIVEDLPHEDVGWSNDVAGWPTENAISNPVQNRWPEPAEKVNTNRNDDDNIVYAQYEFDGIEGELSILPGDRITVISQVDPDWLFGEMNGKQGRFPATFVDHLPADLPPYTETLSTDSSPTSQREADSSCSSSSPMVQGAGSSLESSPTSPSDRHRVSNDNSQDCRDNSSSWNMTNDQLNTAADVNDNAFIEADLEPHCIALYDYAGMNEGDLSFKEGDRITLTASLSEDWLMGYLGDEHGMVPRTYVDIKVDLCDELPEPVGPPPTLDSVRGSVPSVSDIPRAIAIYDYEAQNDEELTIKAGELIVLLDQLGADWFVGELNDVIGRFPVSYVDVITPLQDSQE